MNAHNGHYHTHTVNYQHQPENRLSQKFKRLRMPSKIPMLAQVSGLLSLLVIGAGLITASQLARTSQNLQSSATTGNVLLEFQEPRTATLTATQEKTFNIVATTTPLDLKATAAVIRVKTEDLDLIDITGVETSSTGLPITIKPLFVEQENEQIKQWSVVLGADPSRGTFSGKNNIVALKVKAKGKTGQAKLEIATNSEVAAIGNSVNVNKKPQNAAEDQKRFLIIDVSGTGGTADICVGKTAAKVDGSQKISLPANASVQAGNTVEYTIAVATKTDTESISIRDAFPTASLNYVANSLKVDGTAVQPNATDIARNIVNFTYPVPAAKRGQEIKITYQVTVKADQRNGSFSNMAFVTLNEETVNTDTCEISLNIGEAPQGDAPALRLGFMIQGVNKAGVTLPAEVVVKYKKKGTGEIVTKTFTQNFTSSAAQVPAGIPNAGVFLSDLIPLTGVNLSEAERLPTSGSFGTGIEVYVKTPTTLRKKLGELTFESNQPPVRLRGIFIGTDQRLIVGDFVRTGDNNNVFDVLDVTKIVNKYSTASQPVTSELQEFDVNYDGTFDVLDISLVVSNYTKISTEGEKI